jgi:hypothetical protein
VGNARATSVASTPHGEVSRLGNAGWYFCNVVDAARDSPLADAVKKNPAQIIGLCGCDEAFEERLRESTPAASLPPTTPKEIAAARPHAHEYLTLRGPLSQSTLVGVRGNSSDGLRLREWDRLEHGTYQVKGGEQAARACSEVLLAQVRTDKNIGWIGTSHEVMVVRLHNHFSDYEWDETEVDRVWDRLALLLYNIDVLMGTFGRMVLKVVPELRSRGVVVDLAAWFPFRTPAGEPWVGSNAIFFVGRPGAYKLWKGLADLHRDNPKGILWTGPPEAAVAAGADAAFPILPPGKCGHRLDPDANGIPRKDLIETLTPTLRPEALRQGHANKSIFKVYQKPMDLHKSGGEPCLCVFTDSKAWRSEKGRALRTEKWAQVQERQRDKECRRERERERTRESEPGKGTAVVAPADKKKGQ